MPATDCTLEGLPNGYRFGGASVAPDRGLVESVSCMEISSKGSRKPKLSSARPNHGGARRAAPLRGAPPPPLWARPSKRES
eukprot:1485350-Prymnesium_polylepis.2